MTAASEEAELVARLKQISEADQAEEDVTAAKQAWYAHAAQFLQRPGVDHWWCQHGDVARGLAEVLRYEQQPVVQALWAAMSAQLEDCSVCVNAYHAAQAHFLEAFSEEYSGPLLDVMRRRDAERLAASLGRTKREVKDGDGITAAVTTALFEALSYPHLLEDAEVMAGLVDTLLHIQQWCDLELAAGGRYPGLYILSAHANPAVRALVSSDVELLGAFKSAADLEPVMCVLERWVRLLEFDLFHSHTAPEGERRKYVQTRMWLWAALAGMLGLQQQPAMVTVLQAFPQLADIVVNHATSTSSHQYNALSCLQHMLTATLPGGAFWQACSTSLEELQSRVQAARSMVPNVQLALNAVSKLLAAVGRQSPMSTLDWPGGASGDSAVVDLTGDSDGEQPAPQPGPRPPPLPAPTRDRGSAAPAAQAAQRPAALKQQASPQQREAARGAAWQPTMVDYASSQKPSQAAQSPQQSPLRQQRSPQHAAASSPLMTMLRQAPPKVAHQPQQSHPSQAFGAASSLFRGGASAAAAAAGPQPAQQQGAGPSRLPARNHQDPEGAVDLWPESSSLQWPGRGSSAKQKAEPAKAAGPPRKLAAELKKMRQEQPAPLTKQVRRPAPTAAAPNSVMVPARALQRHPSPPASPQWDGPAGWSALQSSPPTPAAPRTPHPALAATQPAAAGRQPAATAPTDRQPAAAAAADRQAPRRGGIMPMPTTVVTAAATAPTAELQDDDFLQAAGFGDRHRRPVQLPGPLQQNGRRTLTISPLAKGQTGRWAARNMRDGAAGPPKAALNLDEVLRDVLAWDMYAVLAAEASSSWGRPTAEAPSSYDSIVSYVKAFKPLLIEELRASMQQEHEQLAGLAKKGSTLRSYQLHLDGVSRHSHLHRLTLSAPSGDIDREMRADELVLLTKKAPPAAAKSLKAPPLHVIAHVERADRSAGRTELVAVVNIQSGDPGKDGKRLQDLATLLLPRTTWHATRIMSWTPHCRQFKALCALHKLPARLREQLLQPKAHRSSVATASALQHSGLPAPLQTALRAAFNQSQVAAIAESMSGRDPFALVQGPPGTGKTSAVIGIISALMANAAAVPPAIDEASDEGLPAVQVLVCAQSNAAVDELFTRLDAKGVFTVLGDQRTPRLVRMGKLETFSSAANRRFHIDAQAAEYATRGDMSYKEVAEDRRQRKREVEAELGELQAKAVDLKAQAESASVSPPASPAVTPPVSPQRDGPPTVDEGGEAAARARRDINAEGRRLAGDQLWGIKQRQHYLHAELNQLKADIRKAGDDIVRQKREHRQAVIRRADVVASTLISAGGELKQLLPHNVLFDAVVIDEAAQALEPASLIALQLLKPNGKAVLVGDPKQLPATVLSKLADRHHLKQSLFERLQKADYPVALLREQYRMHPSISAWPSKYFYGGAIRDHAGLQQERAAAFHPRPCFPPIAFYNCHEGREHGSGGGGASLANASEAELACVLYGGLRAAFQDDFQSVAVLTPYKAQERLLREIFRRRHTQAALHQDGLEFATVDGFQGREADVVIFSCVRAKSDAKKPGVGFLADVRRMNVALTRARRSLWIVGHETTLQSSRPWQDLLYTLKKRERLLHAVHPFADVLRATKQQLLRAPRDAAQAHAAAMATPAAAPRMKVPAKPPPVRAPPPEPAPPHRTGRGSVLVKRARVEELVCPDAPGRPSQYHSPSPEPEPKPIPEPEPPRKRRAGEGSGGRWSADSSPELARDPDDRMPGAPGR